MSLKRAVLEGLTCTYARLCGKSSREPDVSRIFVLRNNDLGDVMLVTPLLHVLRKSFPESHIGIGVGSWATSLLANNPDVDEVITLDAPWHNKTICEVPWNSPAGLKRALKFIRSSPQIEALRTGQFTVGIDVLGSPYGSMLMVAAGIPYRLGVKGYAGGHSACQVALPFDPDAQVGRFALGFAEKLGATLPEGPVRPRLYLSSEEQGRASKRWAEAEDAALTCRNDTQTDKPLRILVAPGAGFAKKRWPTEHFAALCQIISDTVPEAIIVVGSEADKPMGERITAAVPNAKNLCGQVSLRDSFALTEQADLALTNSSLMMHVAGAFSTNNAVLLGPAYESARAHAKQWGYPETCLVLGPEANHPAITSPEEAFDEIESAGWLQVD